MSHPLLDRFRRARWQAWMARSFSHRVTAYTMLVASLAVAVLGILSLLTLMHLVSERVQAELASRGAVPQSRLQYRMDTLARTAQTLATRSIVRNALTDSAGRRAYLDPFLRELVDSEPGLWNVTITDFRGRPMSVHGAPTIMGEQDARLIERVIAAGAPEQALVHRAERGQVHLVLVQPIRYPPTDSIEGALVLELDVDRLFADAASLADDAASIALLDADGQVLLRAGSAVDGPAIRVDLPVALGTLQLTTRVQTTAWQVYRPMVALVVVFLALGAVALWAIARFSAQAAEAVTRPVRALSALAEAVDRDIGGRGALRPLSCRVEGEDELATLAQAFNRMIQTIHAQHERLESEVRRRTEALAEAQSRLSGILESIQDMLYSVSLSDGRTRYLSPAAARIMGLPRTRGDLDVATFRACVYPEDEAAVATMLAAARRDGFAELRYRIIGHDRAERWVRERVYLVFDEAGQPSRLDGIVADVSAQVLAEQARAAAEARLRLTDQALASTSNGVLILAVSDDQERIVYANEAFHQMTGVTAEHSAGQDWRFLQAEGEDRYAVEELRAAVFARRSTCVTLRLRCAHGGSRWVELSVAPVGAAEDGAVDHLVAVFNDIHERVLSEQRYREVVDSVQEVIFQVDGDGRWTFLNPAWERLTGYPLRESLGRSFLDWVHPEDRPRSQAVHALMAQGRQERCEDELRYLTHDGQVRWMAIHARARRNASGQVQGFTGTLIDMTERHQWEEELHLRDRALQASSNGIVITDAAGTDQPIRYANPAFYRMTGFSEAEVIGSNCRFLQCEDTDTEALDTLRAAVREHRETTVILRNRRKDGTRFWNELSVSPVRDPNSGQVTHYVGIQNDVSAKIEAEKQLFEWYVRLSTIFTLSPDGFVFFDNTDRLAYLNPAFERMVGLNAGDLEGKTEAEFDALLEGLCDPARPYVSVFEAPPGPDALDLAGQTTLSLRGPGARVLQRSVRHCESDAATKVYYFRDVTHETEVDRMKSEFLSTAAHELRTPMASIMGFSELLLTRKYDEARTVDLLQTINRQSARLTGLLNELLDLARIEARAGGDFHFERVSLRALVEESVAALLVPGDARTVQRQWPDSVPELHVDAAKMQQALTNVLSNAYKYSPGGGAIRLEIIEQQASASDRHGHYVGICVRDEGIGMTPEQCARAFERFFRADDSGNIPGTGLGLSLVKEIVELHGGQVSLQSTLGQGTSITLWLPVRPTVGAVVRPATLGASNP